MAEIQDFGKKIGGARKDVWALRGLLLEDLTEMNAMERKSNIKKDNIWVKPDWEQLIKDGTPQAVAYWQNKMRQSLPPRPPADDEQTQENYIEVVRAIKDAVMSVKDKFEINNFYKNFIRENYVENKNGSFYVTIIPEARNIVTNKVLRAAQSSYSTLARDAEKKLFGIPKDAKEYTAVKSRLAIYQYDDDKVAFTQDSRVSDRNEKTLTIDEGWCKSYYYLREHDPLYHEDWKQGTYFIVDKNTRKFLAINLDSRQAAEEKIENIAKAAQKAEDERLAKGGSQSTQKRKGAFTPPQLKGFTRSGPKYRHFRHADGQMFLDDLKFRGGEFGNWLNDNDRQTSLDMAYDSLRDLARILQIRQEDVSLNGSLAIAFGARGRGGAHAGAAHYEPDRQVINLTKMSGAGCLAHEWGHALDHAIGIAGGSTGLASEDQRLAPYPKSFQELLRNMKFKRVQVPSGEISDFARERIENCRKNLSAWVRSVMPRDLPEDMQKAWDESYQAILSDPNAFTGAEYVKLGKGDVLPNSYIEILSDIRKAATNHIIPRDAKRQIAMWAYNLHQHEKSAKLESTKEQTVYTDFFKGSQEFDAQYSKAAHGYWQSDCEMFARAFDCYISDKLRDCGCHSHYLTAYANSFIRPGENGERIAAIPFGDERETLNAGFDKLISELKEKGILHHYEESLEAAKEPEPEHHPEFHAPAPQHPERAEQLSFEAMLFQADQERKSRTSGKSTVASRKFDPDRT